MQDNLPSIDFQVIWGIGSLFFRISIPNIRSKPLNPADSKSKQCIRPGQAAQQKTAIRQSLIFFKSDSVSLRDGFQCNSKPGTIGKQGDQYQGKKAQQDNPAPF